MTVGKLATSDVLGAPGTNYPGVAANGLTFDEEFDSGNDVVTVSPDHRTITFHSQRRAGRRRRAARPHEARQPARPDVGGPYSGTEGTAVDAARYGRRHGERADHGRRGRSRRSAAPGTVCTPPTTNTLTPTITCNDDAVVTATLSVSDPYEPVRDVHRADHHRQRGARARSSAALTGSQVPASTASRARSPTPGRTTRTPRPSTGVTRRRATRRSPRPAAPGTLAGVAHLRDRRPRTRSP